MAKTNAEDLSNKNLPNSFIRTMEDDLKLAKTNPSLKIPAFPNKSDDSTLPSKQKNQNNKDIDKEKEEQVKKEIAIAKEALAKKEKARVEQEEKTKKVEAELAQERVKDEKKEQDKKIQEENKRTELTKIKKELLEEIKKEIKAEIFQATEKEAKEELHRGEKKEILATSEADAKNKNISVYKNAWRDSPLNSKFFAKDEKEKDITKSAPSIEPVLDSSVGSVDSTSIPPNLPIESVASDVQPEKNILNKSSETESDFLPKDKIKSFFSGHRKAPDPDTEVKKTVKKQPAKFANSSLHNEYLNPETRIAQQGFNSLSLDLAAEARQSAGFAGQNPISKEEMVNSGESPVFDQPKNTQIQSEENLRRESSSSWKTILKIVVLILLIAAVSYGIYFYFVLKKDIVSNVVPVEKPIFSNMKQIELVLDFNSNAIPAVKEYAKNNSVGEKKVSQIAIMNISDRQLLKVSDFEKVLTLAIPENFANNLTGEYALILFNDSKNNYLRLGMALKFKNFDSAAALAKDWERSIFFDTNSFLFDESGFYDNSKNFESSNYKNITIRYLFLGKKGLALNYALDKNKNLFLFATSQEDIHYLIDEVQK